MDIAPNFVSSANLAHRPDHITVWNSCLAHIKQHLEPKPYRTWFEPLQSVKLVGNALTLLVPAPIYFEYIEEHYIDVLGAALRNELGERFSLEYQLPKPQNTPAAPLKTEDRTTHTQNTPLAPPTPDIRNPFIIPGIRKPRIDSQLNGSYRFDNFVEGEANRMARSAGYAIAKKPGETGFNPMVIYGAAGVGKTHLVHAIGNACLEQHPDKNILYVTSHIFMNQLVDHIKHNTVTDFINFYNSLDVLIMDDIQFLDKKQRMQEIFFTIFNHLHQTRKQIVLTSDRAPKDMEGIEDRLISRFRWGLIADLSTPDVETRMAIMLSAMEREGVAASVEVLEYLCFHIDNVRGVVGAVTRMKAYMMYNNSEVTMKMAKEIIHHYVATEVQKEISIDGIMQLVADHFKTTTELIKSKTRKREIVEARQLAMFLAKKMVANKSLMAIGEAFGGRDHATVIYSCRTVENLIETDLIFKKASEDVEKKIRLSIG